jgi:ADP-heptose:LPS heptosyltransferase
MKTALLRILFHLFRLLRPRRAPRASPVVLILQYQMPLGCCVHGTPLYAALHSEGNTVIVATRGIGAATLQHDLTVDHLLVTDDPTPSFAAKRAAANQIRRQLRQLHLQPDLVLTDGSSRAGSFALFAAMLHLAPTAGFADAPPLYDRHLHYDWNLSLIDNNLRLAAPSKHVEPAIYFTPSELNAAQALLPQAASRIAFVVQGSGGQNTAWHDERFAAVIRHVESLGHTTVFLGTATDVSAIDRIRTLAGSEGISIAARTTIPELAAALSQCDLLVSVDTGPMHVGRSVDLPMVVLGPSWQRPLEWLPLTKQNVRVLRGPDRTGVPADYRLDEIEAPAVIGAIDELLAHYPPSEASRAARAAARLSQTRS